MPDRPYHGQPNGRVAASRERGAAVPGTPSRKDKGRESMAVQDPGLRDYVGALRKYSVPSRRAGRLVLDWTGC